MKHKNILPEDIDKYLGIIEERAKKHMNGARWMLRSYSRLLKDASNQDEALTILTASMYENQNKELPISRWKEPVLEDLKEYKAGELRVSEFMETELFTAQKGDLVELVSQLMKWKKLKYMLVEDDDGNLVGLVSLSDLFTRLLEEKDKIKPRDLLVKDVMVANPIVVGPDENIKEAMKKMKKNNIGCLPVVRKKELLGIVTTDHFMNMTNRLFEEH